MQVVVVAATRRRQLLRKDFGMQPVKLIHSPPTPIQPAFAVKQPAFSVKRQRGEGSLPVGAAHRQRDLRQLPATTCTQAVSEATFGDINFDCQFTFVKVWVLCCTWQQSLHYPPSFSKTSTSRFFCVIEQSKLFQPSQRPPATCLYTHNAGKTRLVRRTCSS